MVNGKILKFFIIFLAVISFAFGQNVFAYDDTIAHPNIAKMAVETFNAQNNNVLSDYDIKLIMQGAHEEDTPIRWMNHFYDPIYNEGLFFNKTQYQTSKVWATNSEDQTTYGKGDKSWYRAIADYKAGNREEALKELGHIVHLVSDLGVPAHTRNDPHADEWSYEDYVKENWQSIMNSLDKNFSVKELNNLDQAFDELANYSNNNFYSVDTFESSKYKIIDVSGYEKLGNYLIAKNDGIFLFRINENVNFVNVTKEFNKDIIHKNNAQHLIPKSIEYSAGVIKLFFDEVNKEQNISLSANRSKVFTANKLMGSLVGGALAMDDSTFNIFSKAINTGKVANTAFADSYTQIKNGYNEMVKTAQNNLSQITFDQILAAMPNFRVANAPQTTNIAPEISPTPTPILTQMQIPEQIQNIPELIQTAPTLPIQQLLPKTDDSQFHFVFGSGGEYNPSPVVPVAEILTDETILSSTSTMEIAEETPTTTVEIVITTSTEPLVDETSTSTEPIIEPFDSAQDKPEITPIIPVVINEIAWMGTSVSKSQDEWLELYNNTDEDIDLSGWKIKVSDNFLNWNNTGATIKARDYYLLERTNDDTIPDISADSIYKGALKNTGENLILLNNNGETIDQIDNTAGWFAGETGTKYKTMERINPNESGNEASNWQSSDTYSVKGKAYGGARIYGTPKQPNKGYWYLQNLTANYSFDANKTLTLTEENSPYFIDDKTEIPAGYTLKLTEGVVMVGAFNSSYLDVKGKLLIEGTPEKPVIFTSARDTDYLVKNYSNLPDGNPEAGDWSRIEVSENGYLNASNVKFLYGGQKYFAQGGFVFGGQFPARIINNLGGEVNLDYAEFQNNFTREESEDQTYDALIWIEPANGLSATTTIDNSVFDGGYVAIKNLKKNSQLSVANSTFINFTNSTGPISSRYELPILINNIFEDNARDVILLDQLKVAKDTVLDSNMEYLMNIITIDAGATLQILPGTILNFLNKGEIIVNGSLEAIGEENNVITIKPENEAEKWGNIIFTDSTSTLEYVVISGGNNGSKNDGMLWLQNSNITLNNVSLTDARRPYSMVYAKDSNLKMTDSEISWRAPKETDLIIDGIRLDGGSLYLNNTTFNQMDRGIEFYSFSTVETENMTLSHFTNISDLNWWPISMISL